MPLLRFLLAQGIAWALVFAALKLGAPLTGLLLAATQGVLAALVSHQLRAARWWHLIHLGFTPLVWAASQFGVSASWYLAAFVVLALFYWTSFRTQVPLFLTNARTARAVLALLPDTSARILDAGAGTGSLVRPLAAARPDCQVVGIEAAPAPWLIGRLQAAGLRNLDWRRGDFWAEDWSDYDVIYVFLSPVPMAQVWAKAQAQMKAGSRLISNSFAVPDATPERIVPAEAAGGRTLYVYAPTAAPKNRDKGRKNRSVPPDAHAAEHR
ncbi:class I SAM-dependent methyltransferase [Denitromonas iodatirespirans]|uniref:Class I SAM-dependent methyltransferase n=1 Tax=Denitromonas iodatirespirans TaxID=2795389 RepID=A0A944D9G8_DENI1|nr:class I SAM-dependent methyltransferase [Denitromonas iodatirespirans]MBT0960991.1 class I SAM-dependent methyltransferase [Denitromonas iodatirespirans]